MYAIISQKSNSYLSLCLKKSFKFFVFVFAKIQRSNSSQQCCQNNNCKNNWCCFCSFAKLFVYPNVYPLIFYFYKILIQTRNSSYFYHLDQMLRNCLLKFQKELALMLFCFLKENVKSGSVLLTKLSKPMCCLLNLGGWGILRSKFSHINVENCNASL